MSMVTLSLERQKEIDLAISNLLLGTGKSYPEHELLDIVTSLGIEVYVVDFSDFPPGERIEGMIDYNAPARILLNKKNTKERRLFTLAHELGHFVLHQAKIGGRFRLDHFDYSITNENSLEETEANYFAASLLVPKEKLLALMRRLGSSFSVQQVAEFFGVSCAVIEIRSRWLNQNTPM